MFWLFLALLLIALFLALAILTKKLFSMRRELRDLRFSKASQAVKYGKLTEQFIPFAQRFPYSPENFRFLGSPIDGISFEDDSIIFCEFKASSSKLSENQKRIRQLVQEKRVKWLEFNLR